jgi:nucleotide-binding universal stress UspA family protein
MMPNTFVVPLDGSDFAEHALGVATGMARACGGEIEVLTTPWYARVEEPTAYLEKVAAEITDVPVRTILNRDHAPVDAIKMAAAEPGRVVCMTTHGRGRLRWAILGSVAEEVVREVDGPILLVGRHCATTWPSGSRRLVVAVDGTDPEPPVLADSLTWAKGFGLDVEVAYVAGDAAEAPPAIDAIVASFEAAGIRVEKTILHGSHAAGALADAATGSEADLIAMSSHAARGIDRLALGTVTMSVVSTAPCPVLVSRIGV